MGPTTRTRKAARARLEFGWFLRSFSLRAWAREKRLSQCLHGCLIEVNCLFSEFVNVNCLFGYFPGPGARKNTKTKQKPTQKQRAKKQRPRVLLGNLSGPSLTQKGPQRSDIDLSR
jgi:hypothetical protein